MRLDPARAQFLTLDEEKIEVSFGQLSQNGLLYEHREVIAVIAFSN